MMMMIKILFATAMTVRFALNLKKGKIDPLYMVLVWIIAERAFF